MVDELARHAAGMELAGHAEGSILRYCGQQQTQLDSWSDPEGPIDADASVTAAISNQPLERLGRYRRLHECGFYGALRRCAICRPRDSSQPSAFNSQDSTTKKPARIICTSARAEGPESVPVAAPATGTGCPAAAGNAALAASRWDCAGAA